MEIPVRARKFRFGTFEADLHSGELRKHGLKIKMQDQPFQVLTILLERSGEIVTREDLRQRLWPADTFVDFDVGLNSAIKRLRDALADSAEKPRFIETLPRRGYRFIAPAEEVLASVVDGKAAGTTVPSSAETERLSLSPELAMAALSPGRPELETQREPGTTKVHYALALAVITAVVLLVSPLALNLGGLRDRLLRRPNPGDIRSIAVLPLENLTGDPAQEFFTDGMTEALITDLGKISALRIISRTTVTQYKGSKKTLPQIARELEVDAVVEGTVAREAGRVRVTANLIQVFPERHLWAESYDRDLRNVLDLQSEIARAVAERIRITVTPEEKLRLSATQTVNPEAHELYLKGGFYNNKWTKDGFKRGIEYFNQALQREPRNAGAYAGLAVAYGGLGIYGDITGYPRQKAAALKAIEIDDTLAEAHAALAWAKFTYDWDTGGAEREFRRAIELNPSDARAHAWYGVYLAMLGRTEDSLQQVKSARDLDPLSLANTSLAWTTFYHAREYDKAIEVCRAALEMDPNFVPAHWRLVAIYEQQGELSKAIEERERNGSLRGENANTLARKVNSLRKAYSERGAWGYWLQELQLVERERTTDAIRTAEIYTQLGNKDEAFRSLEKAFKDHVPYLILDLPADPAFDGLRTDPRYASLLRRLVPRPE